MKAIYLFMALLLLSACLDDRDRKIVDAAKSAVSHDLFDPSSAQFREIRLFILGENVLAVCGEVNAKNKLGGYVGFRPFYYNPKGGTHLVALESQGDRESIAGMCPKNSSRPISQ